MQYLVLLLPLMLLSGCSDFFERPLDDFDVNFEPELVVVAFFSPQDSLNIVDVRLTEAASGLRAPDYPDDGIPQTATVLIRDTLGNIYQLPFTQNNNGLSGYVLDSSRFRLLPGERYILSVDYEALTAEASFRIPAELPLNPRLTTRRETDGAFTSTYARPYVINAPGENDFYLVQQDILRLDDEGRIFSRQRSLVDFVHGVAGYGNEIRFHEVNLLPFARNTIRLCRCSAPVFRYLDTRNVAINNDENPFAEPTQLFSNVAGGLGTVGGVNCRLLTLP